jgi:creatinine amidohydrolase/Fe(II)-dependent formamide hydrolase-like protein
MRLADLTWLEAERLPHEAQITLRYTDILAVAEGVEGRVTQQLRGSHADETETSMMLYLTPERGAGTCRHAAGREG